MKRKENSMERLETQRLILRPFCKDDVAAIYDIFSDVEVNRFLPWFPLQSKEDCLLYTSRCV